MKINVEQTIKRRISEKISAEMDLKRTTWEILTLEALHNEFGFGVQNVADLLGVFSCIKINCTYCMIFY